MKSEVNYRYPSVADLRARAKCKIPKFAFEYLDGGCNDDVNLKKNTDRIRDIELKPKYLVDYKTASLKTELFGHTYDAPVSYTHLTLPTMLMV